MPNLTKKHLWNAEFYIYDEGDSSISWYDKQYESLGEFEMYISILFENSVRRVLSEPGEDFKKLYHGIYGTQDVSITVTKVY